MIKFFFFNRRWVLSPVLKREMLLWGISRVLAWVGCLDAWRLSIVVEPRGCRWKDQQASHARSGPMLRCRPPWGPLVWLRWRSRVLFSVVRGCLSCVFPHRPNLLAENDAVQAVAWWGIGLLAITKCPLSQRLPMVSTRLERSTWHHGFPQGSITCTEYGTIFNLLIFLGL